jgi:hypothetical protein
MRLYPALFLVLALLVSAGCIEEPSTAANVTTATKTVTTAAVEATPPPVTTPPPAQMAYLANIKCVVGDRSEAAYHCNGDVRITGGIYEEVQVFSRYPDNNTFRSNSFSMGGTSRVSQAFIIFPDLKYKGQTPDYFVRMDGILYPVIWSGSTGTAMSNTPGAEGVDLP